MKLGEYMSSYKESIGKIEEMQQSITPNQQKINTIYFIFQIYYSFIFHSCRTPAPSFIHFQYINWFFMKFVYGLFVHIFTVTVKNTGYQCIVDDSIGLRYMSYKTFIPVFFNFVFHSLCMQFSKFDAFIIFSFCT